MLNYCNFSSGVNKNIYPDVSILVNRQQNCAVVSTCAVLSWLDHKRSNSLQKGTSSSSIHNYGLYLSFGAYLTLCGHRPSTIWLLHRLREIVGCQICMVRTNCDLAEIYTVRWKYGIYGHFTSSMVRSAQSEEC